MNYGRIAAGAVAAWIAAIGIGFVVNDLLLTGVYETNAAVLRPDSEVLGRLPVGFGFMLIAFFAFAHAYAKGYEGGNGIVEGLRFGLTVAIIVSGLGLVWMYVTFPITGSLGLAIILDTFVEVPIYGAIIGAIYKPQATRIAM